MPTGHNRKPAGTSVIVVSLTGAVVAWIGVWFIFQKGLCVDPAHLGAFGDWMAMIGTIAAAVAIVFTKRAVDYQRDQLEIQSDELTHLKDTTLNASRRELSVDWIRSWTSKKRSEAAIEVARQLPKAKDLIDVDSVYREMARNLVDELDEIRRFIELGIADEALIVAAVSPVSQELVVALDAWARLYSVNISTTARIEGLARWCRKIKDSRLSR